MTTTAPELGRAKYIPVDKLEAGMKVHREVMGRGGKVLINSGEILTRKHVSQMQKWEKREKPLGPALPKKEIKNHYERVVHGEFVGGWKPSHFNKNGVLVSSTLASGAEVPAVEANPELSPTIQSLPTKSFATGDTGIESPLFRNRMMREEIRVLEGTNAQLGGMIHTVKEEIAGETELQERKKALVEDNQKLIDGLKANPAGGNSDEPNASESPKKRGRPKDKR